MYNVNITERMAEIMEEDKFTIKEDISTAENTFTVFVAKEDVKEESTENQGKDKHLIYICIYLLRMIDFCCFLELKLKNLQTIAAIDI